MDFPTPDNEAERLAWLRRSRLLDTPPETAFDDLTRLAAQVCGMPIAAVTLLDEERQWFKSVVGLAVSETPRAHSFCAHAILEPEVLVVPDTAQDARFQDNPFVTGDPNIRFYAGAPLVTSEGFALGSLCVLDMQPRRLTGEQTALLQILARQVADRIELQRRIVLQEEMLAEQARLMAERLRVEDALYDSEQRLRLALESGKLGSFDLDVQTGQYLDISNIWRVQFNVPLDAPGFSAEQWRQTIHPDDRDRVSEAVTTALHDHDDYAAEYRIVFPGGVECWVSAHGTPVYDPQDRPLRIVGVTQDITDRKTREAERERELREAEERAERDPLTGLWNHRAFHKRLEEEAVRAQREGTTLGLVMLDIDGFKFFNDTHGHAVGDGVLRQIAQRLQAICRPYDTPARYGGDEFSLILSGIGPATGAEVEARLKGDLQGMVFLPDGQEIPIPITVSVGVVVFSGGGTDRLEAMEAADERLRRVKAGGASDTEADLVRLVAQQGVQGYPMLDALVTAVDNKDRYTRRHSEDVMEYSLLIARALGMDEETLHTVAVAALLHDVGKIGVSDAILRKPGPLTGVEFASVMRHPQMGAAIVGAVPGLENTLDAVRHHHERWDGKGYPSGLTGEETPLMARLMAVADAFSAMTTDRPYRKGMDRKKATALLEAGAGKQWDPACVQAFLKAQPDNPRGVRES